MIKENRLLLGTSPFGYPTPRTVIDSQGRCRHHPHVVLRKKSVMRGWKIVLPNCPECVAFYWKRRQQLQLASKTYYKSESKVDEIHHDNAVSVGSSGNEGQDNSSKGSRKKSTRVSKNHTARRSPNHISKPSSDDRTVDNQALEVAAKVLDSPSHFIPNHSVPAVNETTSIARRKNETSPQWSPPHRNRRASTGNAPSPRHLNANTSHVEEVPNVSYVRHSSEPVPTTYCARAAVRSREARHLSNSCSFTSYKSQKSMDPDGSVMNSGSSQCKLKSFKRKSSSYKSKDTLSSSSSPKKSSQDKCHSFSATSMSNVAQDSENSTSTLDIGTDARHSESCSIGPDKYSCLADRACQRKSPNESQCSNMHSIPEKMNEPNHDNRLSKSAISATEAANTFYLRRSSAPTPATFKRGLAERTGEPHIPTKHSSFTSYKSQRSRDPDGYVVNRDNSQSISPKKSNREMNHSYFVISETNVAQDFTNSKSTLEMNTDVASCEYPDVGAKTADIADETYIGEISEKDNSQMPVIPVTKGSTVKKPNHDDYPSNHDISGEEAETTFFIRRSSAPTPPTYNKGTVARESKAPFPSKHSSFTSYKSQRSMSHDGQVVDYYFAQYQQALKRMSSDQPKCSTDCSPPKKSSQEIIRSCYVISETNVAQDFKHSKCTLEMNTGVKHGESFSEARGLQSDIAHQTSTGERPQDNAFSSMPFIRTTQQSELKEPHREDHLSNSPTTAEAAVKPYFSRRSSAPTPTTFNKERAAFTNEVPFPSKYSSFTSYQSQRSVVNHDNTHSKTAKKSSQEMNHSYYDIRSTDVAQDFTVSKSTLEMNTSVKRVEHRGIGRSIHSDLVHTHTRGSHNEKDGMGVSYVRTTQESKMNDLYNGDYPSNHINAESSANVSFIRRSSAPTHSTFNEGMVARSSRAPFPSKHSSFNSYESPGSIDPDDEVMDCNYTEFKQAWKPKSSEQPNPTNDCSLPKKSIQEMNNSYFVISETNAAQDFTNSKSTLDLNTDDKRRIHLNPSSSQGFHLSKHDVADNQTGQLLSTESNSTAMKKDDNAMLSIPEYSNIFPSAAVSAAKQEEERDVDVDTLEGSESYPYIFVPNSNRQPQANSTCSSFTESNFSNMVISSFANSFAESWGENEPYEGSVIFASGMRHVISFPPYDEGSYTGQIDGVTKLPHGEGSFIHSSGELIKGIWKDGLFVRRFDKHYGHSPSQSNPSSQGKTLVMRNR
eukprot:CCRYP_016678-RA/>CCRYP_016678-RA protein AED:0.02 eAED:0.02 QI:29/1/1/1/1/1/2/350/1223